MGVISVSDHISIVPFESPVRIVESANLSVVQQQDMYSALKKFLPKSPLLTDAEFLLVDLVYCIDSYLLCPVDQAVRKASDELNKDELS